MTERFSAAARARHVEALGAAPFDLVVVGGGITGAGIAREAVMRGWRVALVERDDFASGTSSRSSRMVHGGLRYLETGQIHLVYEASRERRTLMRIAPHLVRPLQFVWPLYEHARLSPWKVRLGLTLYDALSLFRNIANHRMLTTQLTSATEPDLRPYGLRGAACYYDATTDDSRLTLATVRSACEGGAVTVNHAAVTALVAERGEIRGARVTDLRSGREVTVRSRVVVNATGPWSDQLRALARAGLPPAVRGTKGVHIAVSRERLRNQNALTVLSPIDGRVMFILPAGDLAIVGTTDTDYAGDPDEVRPDAPDVAYLIRSANAFFPRAHLGLADVVCAWAGVRPLVARGDGAPGAVSREHDITWTMPGLLTVTGGKLTTYRAMAEQTVDRAARALQQPAGRGGTDRVALPGGAMDSYEDEVDAAHAAVTSLPLAHHLVQRYGSEWPQLWAMVTSEPALREPVAPGRPYLRAELRWAVEREMALTLGDLLIRRLHVAFETADHALGAAAGAAQVVAPLLGWSAPDVDAELAHYADEVARTFTIDPAGDARRAAG